ncbi:hypothetical protein ZIOFF_002140 [Zingiber officinale]|uniref:ATP-dependent DNA helicase n=1 Tax=Zingiber officinale TaxID=94328 RepID=A0A8J5M995_ZINOF|nr:hypothetical protein ZIOFF_002140 [Zingiber officinale]
MYFGSSRPPTRLIQSNDERRRQLRTSRQRERRETMTQEQRQAYLSQGRANYRGQSRDVAHQTFANLNLPINTPVELQSLFAMENEEGRHFRQYVRAYNHVFAFTSMGVHIDETLASGANGIYTFRTQGNIYHSIGSLLPSANNRPRYMQMWIVDTDNEVNNRLLENQGLRRELLIKIQHILDQYNPFVHIFRQIGRRKDIPNCKLIIKQQPSNQRQYSLPTASQVAAVIVHNEGMDNLSGRDIIVESVAGSLINIQDVAGYYDPLQYPLLLAYGTYGWDINTRNIDGTRLTCLHYYAHMLQTYGKPDLMLTMTCNPNWIEIKEQLLSGQSPQDRPDLITRVFKAKFEEFKKDILDRGVLGKVISYSYVIEYQKRGLLHVHMLIIFATSDKLHTPDDFDSVVRAEIPSPRDEVQLYEAVIHHMIHGPCGSLNTKSPCMRDGICKKKFPKPFQPYTTQGNDSYPLYRRREGAPISINHDSQIMVDNGGTGKTFLYRSILAHLRKQGKIVIAVATSGIAATLLPGGRTAHSRLKIPLMSTADTLCKIEKQSDLAELIRRASAIVWDEAPMANRYSFESVNKTFQDIMGNVLAFGGKTMVFGGDFRQVLPVVKRGSVREQIAAREEKEYISWDSVEDDNNNFFQEEFLNSLTPSDLPPHIITLKVGCPIMLLRNVAPELGLCNGTRLICRSLGRNFINAEIITSPHKDTSIISFHRPPILSSSTSRISLSLPPRVDEGQGRPPPTPSRFLRWSLAAAPHSHVPPHAPTTAVSADSRGFHREKDHTDRSSASDHRPRCPRRPQPPSSGKLVTTDHQLQKLLDRGCAHVVPVQEGITDAQTTQPQPRLIAGAPTVAVLHG